MIDIPDDDIVAERRCADGRWVLFTRTDLPQDCPIAWWGVTASTGGDGHGFLVRLDETYGSEGWTLLDLLDVALARAKAERSRRFGPPGDETLWRLHLALRIEAERVGRDPAAGRVVFRPGAAPSPYPWTIASLGPFELPFCPDPAGQGEGITLEQLLLVLDRLAGDAARAAGAGQRLAAAAKHITAALAGESRRLAAIRAKLAARHPDQS